MDANDLVRRIHDNLHWHETVANNSLQAEEKPMSLKAQIEAIWSQPDEVFACGLYLALLRRMPDPEGMTSLCGALAAGMKRTDVVRALAFSEEGLKQGLDVSWLPPPDAPPPRPRRFSLARMRSTLGRLTGIRPRSVWKRVKQQLRRLAS
jgi:hypothetical protein